MIGIVFYPSSDSLHGATLTCLNTIRTKSLEDVYLMSTFRRSFPSTIINLLMDASVCKRPLRKFFKVESTSLLYLEMPISVANDVMLSTNGQDR